MNEDVTLQLRWAGKNVEVTVSAEDFAALERVRLRQEKNDYGTGEEAAWKALVAEMDMTEMDKAKGALHTLQDVVTFGKGDEIAAYTAAGFQGLRNLVSPTGVSAQDVFQTSMRNINDRIEAERLQRGLGVALLEGTAGYVGGKGAYDVASGISGRLAKPLTGDIGTRTTMTGASGQPFQAGYNYFGRTLPKDLSAFSYTRVYPGRPVPRHLRPASDKYRTFTQLATAAAAGAAGAGDYGYWSGEGGLPMEEQREGDRWTRYAASAPWGALLGTTMGGAARYGPYLGDKAARVTAPLRSKLPEAPPGFIQRRPTLNRSYQAIRKQPVSDSATLESLIAQLGPGEGRPADYETAAEVLATTRLKDSLIPSLDTSVRRTGMDPEEMLGDVGYFDPLTRQVALAQGGETVASAGARARIENRAQEAADAAQLGLEVPIRGESAEQAALLARDRTEAAYTAAKELGDVAKRRASEGYLAIDEGGQQVRLLNEDPIVAQAYKNAMAVRRSVAAQGRLADESLTNTYPSTVRELTSGRRRIDQGEEDAYRKEGWKIEVEQVPTRDALGVPTTDDVHFAVDPRGPGMTTRQANEISNELQKLITRTEGDPNYVNARAMFDRFFTQKSGALSEAGEEAYKAGRLKDITTGDTPAQLLALTPDELARHIDYDRFQQGDSPLGRKRTAQQKVLVLEGLWDQVSREVSKAEGRPSQELIDHVGVLLRDQPAAFTRWKDAVAKAEKYGIARERAGKAYRPEVDFREDLRQQVGGFGRRMAEFFFSAPFAATRALDRSLTKTSLIRNQAVNDAVVDILTKTGKQRDAAERLIQRKIAEQTVSVSDQKILREVFVTALGLGQVSGDVSDMPYVGAAGKKLGMGLLYTGEKALGLIPGVQ